MNLIAESYVKLVLALGQHDPDYVDAYYGPLEYRIEVESAGRRPLADIRSEALGLISELRASGPAGIELDAGLDAGPDAEAEARLDRLRQGFLIRQLSGAGRPGRPAGWTADEFRRGIAGPL